MRDRVREADSVYDAGAIDKGLCGVSQKPGFYKALGVDISDPLGQYRTLRDNEGKGLRLVVFSGVVPLYPVLRRVLLEKCKKGNISEIT